MKRVCGQILVLLWLIHLATASIPRLEEPKENVRKNRSVRDISCKAGTYEHNGICCLKCPAGTYVKEHCTEALQVGTCEPCDYGTYIEYENGLNQCLSCTKCPPDQVITKFCTRTSNSECQCKQGFFCLPHHACEVCKKCSKCKEEEVEKKQCTPTSNTICEKKTTMDSTVVIVVVFVVLLLLILGGVAFYLRKTLPHKLRGVLGRKNPHQRNVEENVTEDRPAMKEPVLRTQKKPVGSGGAEDEDTGLGDSLPHTASSSQASLSVFPPASHALPYCSSSGYSYSASHNPLTQPLIRAMEHTTGIPRLIPSNGDESLKKSFDLFEEVDVLFHKRFFRHIGLSDNDIRSVESCHSDDKMYTLLRIWMEREGMKANFNDLIDALLHLDQKLSAENIIARAVGSGLYGYEEVC